MVWSYYHTAADFRHSFNHGHRFASDGNHLLSYLSSPLRVTRDSSVKITFKNSILALYDIYFTEKSLTRRFSSEIPICEVFYNFCPSCLLQIKPIQRSEHWSDMVASLETLVYDTREETSFLKSVPLLLVLNCIVR